MPSLRELQVHVMDALLGAGLASVTALIAGPRAGAERRFGVYANTVQGNFREHAAVLRRLAADGGRHAVVVPIGFVCDHVEVLYDLDVEARAVAADVGVGFHRAAAANDHPAFIAMLVDLVRQSAGRAPS